MKQKTDVLFVTLDSCRYDAFVAARTPNLRAIGPLVRAFSPSHFTFGAHAAFFMGFTPSDPARRERFVNSKFGKIFRMTNGGHRGPAEAWIELSGRNIVDGFRQQGYRAIGTGAVGWFDPATETGKALTADFERFQYTGGPGFRAQRAFLLHEVEGARAAGLPVFAFANLGETHVPYWHEGAAWDASRNPCVPFAGDNDADESRRRQIACVEWIDREIAPLLAAFDGAAIVVCSDHGECWGEDGLWEHGIHHPRTLEVPLLFRLP
jgi:Sulfatase